MAIHKTAIIAPDAVVPASCEIGPNVIIGENVVLGENVNIINSSKCLKKKVLETLEEVGFNSLKEEAKIIIRCTGNKDIFNVSWLDLKYDVLEEVEF